jgi:hypothetical protein
MRHSGQYTTIHTVYRRTAKRKEGKKERRKEGKKETKHMHELVPYTIYL